MNKIMQQVVANCLKKMSKIMPVILYVGKDVRTIFVNTNVQVKIFDRVKYFIPHFIVTSERFELSLAHTEKKLIRVDIDSSKFDKDTVQRIIQYFDSLITELDRVITIDSNKAG